MPGAEHDLEACKAESQNILVHEHERTGAQRACMSKKGYAYVDSAACKAFQTLNSYDTMCFRRG